MKARALVALLSLTFIPADIPSPEVTLDEHPSADLLSVIRPGVARSEVESFLALAAVPQAVDRSFYNQPTGFLIMVPYDEAGGILSPSNKVNGLPRRISGRWRRTRSSKL